MTAKFLGVSLNLHKVDIRAGEKFVAAFDRANPQHTVPSIIDNGFSLSESKAICGYLVNKYSPDNLLYPQRAENHAIVDQRLFFAARELTSSFLLTYGGHIYNDEVVKEDSMHNFTSALNMMDKFLIGTHWIAGHHATIADICMLTVVNTAVVCDFNLDSYDNVSSWMRRCKDNLSGYEESNTEGLDIVRNNHLEALKKTTNTISSKLPVSVEK